MPDLTIEHIYTCPSNLHWEKQVKGKSGTYTVTYGRHEAIGDYQVGWSCTCPQFKFRKKECKHIQAVKHERCGWNEEAFSGSHADAPGGKCPKCGEDAEVIKVGV